MVYGRCRITGWERVRDAADFSPISCQRAGRHNGSPHWGNMRKTAANQGRGGDLAQLVDFAVLRVGAERGAAGERRRPPF